MISSYAYLFAMKKNIFLLSLTFLLIIPEILADKRAERGKCYISIGYVNDRAGVAEFAKNSFIKPENFELFEREDKRVYLTLGKIDENLFKKLQSQNKTYDFNCSRGKGYEERLGLNSEFEIIGGNKINIVSPEQFLSVVSSIEIEKQRLVDLEIEKQVQARLAAEKEKQRLAELERQRKAEADRLAAIEKAKQDEIDRLAAIEKAKQKAETDRLAAIEKAKQDELDRLAAIEKAKQDEIDRLAAIEKAKQAEILRKKQEAERERKAKLAAEKLAKEYPYYVVVSCGFDGRHMNVLACFSGRVDTELELSNGRDYGLYKAYQIGRLGKEYRDGLHINLRSTFDFKAQNSSENLILGAKVFSRATGDVLFQKQVSKYGVIRVSN